MSDKGYKIATTALIITRDLTQEEWLALGVRLAEYARSISWAIGDWAMYGDKQEWEAASVLVADADGRRTLTVESIRRCAYVAQAFPPSLRRDDLSWSHYYEALRLPGNRRLDALDTAANGSWSVIRFREWIGGQPPASARPAREKPSIRCPQCGYSWVRDGSATATDRAAKSTTTSVNGGSLRKALS